ISTSNNFTGANDQVAFTDNTDNTFIGLLAETVYYGQVRAVNHSGIPTSYLILGSTQTSIPNAPTNLHVTTATSTGLTAAWDSSVPAGNTYTLQLSTSNSDFIPIAGSSNTALTTATINGLSVNTTYYSRVNSLINGSSSPFTSSIATATL